MAKEAPSTIDMNRGLVMKYHPSGVKVNMYYDQPGVFLDQRGSPLPEAFAKGAGFEVEKMQTLARLHADRALVSKAMQEALSSETRDVVEERAVYRLVSMGNGFFHIEKREDDTRISDLPMNDIVAHATFDQLDPPVAVDEPVLFGKKVTKDAAA